MKRIMMFVIGAAVLLAGTNAASAEEGWKVYRKARPNPVFKAEAVAKILAPFGISSGPPIEEAPDVTMDQVTMTLYEGEYENLRIRSTDIVFLAGNGRRGWVFIHATGESLVIEPGAILLYCDPDSGSVSFASLATNTRIGEPGAELVNFSGKRVLEHALLSSGGGSYAVSATTFNSMTMNNTVRIDDAVFVNHLVAIYAYASNGANVSVRGSNLYMIRNKAGIRVAGKDATIAVRMENPYFAENRWDFTSDFEGEGMSTEFVDANITGDVLLRQNVRYSIPRGYDSWYSFFAEYVTFKETRPITGVVQTWPRGTPFSPADFTADGGVNIDDVNYFANAFGDSSGSIRFGRLYDLNQDGIVNLPDLVVLAYAYAGVDESEPITALSASPRMYSLLATVVMYPAVVAAAREDPLFGPIISSYIATAVLEADAGIPSSFSLSQNYPNPFNPETAIRFSLPEAGYVTLAIYNSAGQLISRLVDEWLPAGVYTQMWDGTSNSAPLASGTYFCRLMAGTRQEVRKMLLLR